ncbi:MAG: hypothetical protein ACREHG_04990 [Candidatus Saccharimonadales bacterium]
MTTPITIELGDIADIYPLTIPTTAVTQSIQTGMIMLHGWSIANPSATTAGEIDVYNGDDANGQLAAGIIVPASDSKTHFMGLPGILLDVGLAVDVALAGMVGVLWVSRPAQ